MSHKLCFSHPGGHHTNHEDEEEDQQRPAADGAGGDPEEHVSAPEEDDQGADRVAHRAQVHKEGRDGHQHLPLHGIERFTALFFTPDLRQALKNLPEETDEDKKMCLMKMREEDEPSTDGVDVFVFLRRRVCLSLLPSSVDQRRGTAAPSASSSEGKHN